MRDTTLKNLARWHVDHPWRIEGRGKIRTVFSSTGKAILLTSLTTMLAFGSMVFYVWRGFGQLGSALFIGVEVCFLATVIVLSGVIGIIERKNDNRNQNIKCLLTNLNSTCGN